MVLLLSLLAFSPAAASAATPASGLGVNGWYRITSQDANLGQINIIEQWGMIPANQVPTISSANQSQVPFNFPLQFPSVCWVILPYLAFTSNALSGNFLQQNAAILPVAPFNTLSNTLLLGWQSSQQSFNQNVYGIGWRALGY